MAELTAQGGLMKGKIALLLALGVLALSVLAAVATPSANAARGTTSGRLDRALALASFFR
jgi:hypothetical protein